MGKIAVFVNEDSNLCDFFGAERFLLFERDESGWRVTDETYFERIAPSSPALTRKNTEALLPLLEGCAILAGGALAGIPFAVFDRAGLHIFEIGEISDGVLDGIIDDLNSAQADKAAKEAVIHQTKLVESEVPGVYFLDLIALQSECPEISSKKAMADFLEHTPFLELHLVCRHIPPWIEAGGKYDVKTLESDGDAVKAVITRRC